MNDWDSQWSANKNKSTLPRTELVRFGAESATVHHTERTPVTVKQGGGLSNGILLMLTGFAVGTLWGEPLINKVLGTKK